MELISKAFQLDDTIVAPATPTGSGAIAILRLSGKDSFRILEPFVRPKAFLSKPTPRHAYLRQFYIGEEHLDEVIMTCYPNPGSYTGEDLVEINCHASPFIVREMMKALVSGGARLAERGEFTFRAFLNKKLDLSQAEAVADLISSKNGSQHRLALDQMKGGYSQYIQQLRCKLVDFLSLLELELDFGEEDVEFADRTDLLKMIRDIRLQAEMLIQSFEEGNALKNGVPVVLFGRPNAGKSSLLNVLLKEDRAIVSNIEGTTRDTIEESLLIDGVEYRLIDTAGLREAQDAIEEMGVKKTIEKISRSMVLVYVMDVSRLNREELENDLRQFLPDGNQRVLIVANKMDLRPEVTSSDFINEEIFSNRDWAWIPISARNNMNIEYLKEELSKSFRPNQGGQFDLTITNVRHLEALTAADEQLQQAEGGIQQGLSSDLVALHLRYASDALGSICGHLTTDELLGNIFSNFCIGK